MLIVAAVLSVAYTGAARAEVHLQVNRVIATTPFVNSTVSIQDGEGMAYVPITDSLWIADDTADRIFEVERVTGMLLSHIQKSSLALAVEFEGTTLAGVSRAADLESLAYDPVNDVLYAFSTDCCPSPPTVFRLVRSSAGQPFRAETYRALPSGFRPGAAFSGAAFHPTEGLYVAGGLEIRPYDYVTNTLGEPVAIDPQVTGTIFGMGFSLDGDELWVVTSADKVYRIDWASKRLVAGQAFDLLEFGITDGRALEVIDNQLYVVDGAGSLAVTVFDIVGAVVTPPPPPADTQAPGVSITSPVSGATVMGTVTIQATAADNVGVTRIDYMVDGSVIAALSPPAYSLDWLSGSVADGQHTLTVRAHDAAGNTAVSTPVTVTVVTPAPAPLASSLTPSAAAAGGSGFTLTVSGSGFTPSSVVQWGGANRATTFVSNTELRATIGATDIATAGTAQVTVATPSPGGGTSVPLFFAITSTETGLIGLWAFSEGTGTQATDISGDGHGGTLMNGAAWSSGTLAFDGVDDYVEVAHAPDLNAYPLTVATWINTTSSTGVGGVIGKYVAGTPNGWGIFLNEGRLCAWYYRSATSYVSNSTGCPFNVAGVNDGRWHHVVFVVDLFGGRIYVDGVRKLIISWTGSGGAVSTTQPVSLGRYSGAPAGAGYFAGRMDSVRIYNRALNGTEVVNLYNSESATPR
jgi:hypothetical protein